MPDALERTQGVVKKAAGILPHVCKLRSAFRLLLLLFTSALFLAASPYAVAAVALHRVVQTKVWQWLMAAWAGGTSLDVLLHLPLLMGKAGTDLLLVTEELHSQLVSEGWHLQMAQHREGAANGMLSAEIFLTHHLEVASGISHYRKTA